MCEKRGKFHVKLFPEQRGDKDGKSHVGIFVHFSYFKIIIEIVGNFYIITYITGKFYYCIILNNVERAERKVQIIHPYNEILLITKIDDNASWFCWMLQLTG